MAKELTDINTVNIAFQTPATFLCNEYISEQRIFTETAQRISN